MQQKETEKAAEESGLFETAPLTPKFRSGAVEENPALEDLEQRFRRIVRALSGFQQGYPTSKNLKNDIEILGLEIHLATEHFEDDIETARDDLERESEAHANIMYACDLVEELPGILGSAIEKLLDAPDLALRARFSELSKRMHLNEPVIVFDRPSGGPHPDPFGSFNDSVQSIASTIR